MKSDSDFKFKCDVAKHYLGGKETLYTAKSILLLLTKMEEIDFDNSAQFTDWA